MRFFDRSSVKAPVSLADPDSNAAKERQRAQAHYTSAPAPDESFKFSAYKGDDVVTALEALFAGKCAYCESKVTATQPIDVEHYRPKGAVAEDSKHPGYWWLALEWENLLPSCIDCNRRRKQYLIEGQANGAPVLGAAKQLAGKKDAFPIRGKVRACKPGDDLHLEDPLLIDPTRHNPEDHLQWNIDELNWPVVVPRVVGIQPSAHGEASINVYGLNRLGLVQERSILLANLAREAVTLDALFRAIVSMPPGGPRAALLQTADTQLTAFRETGKKTARYSAVAEVFVTQTVQRLRKEFRDALALPSLAP